LATQVAAQVGRVQRLNVGTVGLHGGQGDAAVKGKRLGDPASPPASGSLAERARWTIKPGGAGTTGPSPHREVKVGRPAV
jgi:hypothetical protein